MASLFDLFKALRAIESLSAAQKQWTGTHNGTPLAAVTDVGSGMHGLSLWVQAKYKEADATDAPVHVLWGEARLFGRETVKIDNTDVDGDDLVISPHGDETPKRIVIEYKFKDKNGAAQHYAFELKYEA